MQTCQIPNKRALSARRCNYLIQTKTGICTFRWNILVSGKHHQPRVSLKTRNYLEAISIASQLARAILAISNPTIDQVKAVYAQFSETQAEAAMRLSQVDIEVLLSDLSVKCQKDYLSTWRSFLAHVDGDALSVVGVRQSHIESWKATQTCADTTLKKKLRLLSSCFEKARVACEAHWFRYKVKTSRADKRRAFTDTEVRQIFRATAHFKHDSDNWRYYLPRLAVLTGCRLNELAQLRVEDISLQGIPYISINDNAIDKKVKNESSFRKVLLPFEVVKLLTSLLTNKSPGQRVFVELPYSDANGYAPRPSKYFSDLCRNKLGLNGVSFHSFRHFAINHLFNAGVKEELIGSLVGHRIGKMTTGKVYLSGFNDILKLEAMNHLGATYSKLDD